MDSVVINNEDLRQTFHELVTIRAAVENQMQQVRYEKSNLNKTAPPYIAQLYTVKYDKALAFADGVVKTANENAVTALIATFERVVFAKYRTSYGKIKTVVQSEVKKPFEYYSSRERFVNTHFDFLAQIISLLDGLIDKELEDKLKLIKLQRNYIAHGKRDMEAPEFEMSIEEIARTLDDVVKEIEK